jgi:hypothetical protein
MGKVRAIQRTSVVQSHSSNVLKIEGLLMDMYHGV